MKFARLNIAMRLGLSFGIVLVLLAAGLALGLSGMAAVNAHLTTIVQENNVKLDAATRMRDAQRRVAIAARNIVLLSEREATAEQEQAISKARRDYNEAAAILHGKVTLDAGKAILNRIQAARAATIPMMDKAVKLGLANDIEGGTRVLMHEVRPLAAQWQDALQDMVEHQHENNLRLEAQAREDYAETRLQLMLVGLVSLLASAACAWWGTRSVVKPLAVAVQAAQAVAEGDLTGEVEVKSEDETGQLLRALNAMSASLQKVITEVRAGTGTIATATSQLAGGNLDLSARTEQQASALEQTASSMEELTSTVKQNAESARHANVLARSASEVAVSGGAVVSQVVATMSEINTSAMKIVDIISVIDAIAFQTNILALNAAVEAARAGEQGRGFAVVASEVRTLAQRSASAAKEIKVLIGDSVDKVAAGTRLVNQAGGTMEDIVSSVRRVTDIMREIADASREQEAGIEQINQAITEMDGVTQQNAALVEQAAAASGAMQDQANDLMKLVSTFKLPDTAPPLAVTSQAYAGPDVHTSRTMRPAVPATVLPLRAATPPLKRRNSQPPVPSDEAAELAANTNWIEG